jgi:hypothetical protein
MQPDRWTDSYDRSGKGSFCSHPARNIEKKFGASCNVTFYQAKCTVYKHGLPTNFPCNIFVSKNGRQGYI